MTTISAVNILSSMYAKSPVESQNSAEKSGPVVAAGETSPLSAKATSVPKTIYEVAADARTALDASYDELGVTSETYQYRTGAFRREMFDALDFDRRTLFAISSDQGGQFSEEEIEAAKSAMHDQLAAPLEAASVFPSNKKNAAAQLSMIEFLDTQASPEEKASLGWAKARAAAQVSYQLQTQGKGQPVDSGDPVVGFLLNSYQELFASYGNDMSELLENMPSYQLALEAFAERNDHYSSFSITV